MSRRSIPWLRMGDDPVEAVEPFDTLTEAVAEYRSVATELARYDQRIGASIHYAKTFDEVVEYPDFALSLGPRGGVRVDPC